jgi:type I restriction enzyme S subunit
VPVARPPDDLCQRFEEQILPIVLLLLNRRDAISNLKATRDLLLPKLISGELEVSAMFEPEVLAA